MAAEDNDDRFDEEERRGPMLIILFAVVLIPTALVSTALGGGAAAVVGGLVALFALIAFLGGSLRADLRMAAVAIPVLLVAAIAPRLLAGISRPASIALVVVFVFVAALLPAKGRRYTTVGLGLGMATLFGYAMAFSSPVKPWQFVLSVLVGMAIALLLRVLFGVADPSKSTREAVAAVLDDDEATMESAVEAWLSDDRPRWLGAVLASAARYRLALHAIEALDRQDEDPVTADTARELRSRGAALAERVRAKKHDDVQEVDQAGEAPSSPARLSGPAANLQRQAERALDEVEAAESERSDDQVPLRDTQIADVQSVFPASSFRPSPIQLRHALRTALGLLMMLLATSYLPAGDPLVASALVTTFSILQASWRETLARARPRIVGLVIGSALAGLLLVTVPSRFLVVVAVVALLVSLWNVVSRPVVGYTLLIPVTVGLNAATRHLDPVRTLVEYAVLTGLAVVVGVVIGFLVVPGLRPKPLAGRIRHARAATMEALREQSVPSPESAALLRLHREAARARTELVPDHERLPDDVPAELERYRSALGDLAVLGAALVESSPKGAERLRRLLGPGRRPDEGGPDAVAAQGTPGEATATLIEPILLGLVEQADDSERRLLAGLGR